MTQSDPLSHPSHAIPSLLGVVLQNNSHVATEGSRHGPFAVDQTHVTGVRRALYDDVDDHEDSLDDDDSIEDDSIDSNDSNAASNSASDSESDDKADEEERIEDLLKAMDESMLMTYAVAQPNGDAFKEARDILSSTWSLTPHSSFRDMSLAFNRSFRLPFK